MITGISRDGSGFASPVLVSTIMFSRVRYRPYSAAFSTIVGCQMMPPVLSPPSAVKIQPSVLPTLVKPRKIQVGMLTTAPASARTVPAVSP